MAAATAIFLPLVPAAHDSSSFARPSSARVHQRPISATASALPSWSWAHGPLVPASDHWGDWTFLLSTAAVGIWSEKSTAVGKALSGALVSVLVGLAASSAGVVSADAPACRVVLDYLLPLAIPLLLFGADLLKAFLHGSLATTIGTMVAFLLVPMRSLGQENWKIAAALMCRHTGGAVNYVAVSEALEVSSSVQAAGLAAD
uniref:Uncharacterized protein n=2 Tax=Arundo donax TaxID=35708 RepID=A0A0A9CLU3_ARUDO